MEFLSIMMQVWERYWSLFLEGLGMTVYMGLVTVLISTVSGSLMALMRRSRLGVGKFRPISWIATVYVEVIRGTPILLQLYFFYFMLPQWLPFLNLSEFTCVMVACCVNSTAYVCEIVRAGIQAVDAEPLSRFEGGRCGQCGGDRKTQGESQAEELAFHGVSGLAGSQI